jgi:IMP dehydrogenase
MATFLKDVSRTFSEYLLIPRLTRKADSAEAVCLASPLSTRASGLLSLQLPLVSASMQSVTGVELAIKLAREGGVGFIYCSQSIESQAEMVSAVKQHKAGFVRSRANIRPEQPLADVVALTRCTGYSTIPVTQDGSPNGKLVGIITDSDYWEDEDDLQLPVSEYMTPLSQLVFSQEGVTLLDVNRQLRASKKACLPVLDSEGYLKHLVFKKDYVDHKNNPNEVTDEHKRLLVGAGVNTHDYQERLPRLLAAGVDVVCFDSSDGFSEYQAEAACWAREHCGDQLIVGGGNVVSAEGFDYLVRQAGLDFVKVGIGGGSICTTREVKGIGRGQASALMDVAQARDRYHAETGRYIPICSDGGLMSDTQIIIALAMGADFVMMGRYFASVQESPTDPVEIEGGLYKPYWGEGSNRARNWQRYGDGQAQGFKFEEGVDGYIPIAGTLKEVVDKTRAKLAATMVNCGSVSLAEFRDNAILTRVSEQTFTESGTSKILFSDK